MNMETMSLQRVVLQARLMLARSNPVTLAAIVVAVLGLLCSTIWLWHLQTALDHKQDALRQMTLNSQTSKLTALAVSAAVPVLNDLQMQKFNDVLGDNGYAEQQLKTIFRLAAKNNLYLAQGDYKSSFDKNSATLAYQIQLPVKGAYPAIREFCEEVLLAIPFASLDEINFKRDAISNNVPEARLRFTLYLKSSKNVLAIQQ